MYDEGMRVTSPMFTAFCLKRAVEQCVDRSGARVGFTVPRAVGKAVVRNRLKRRFRELMRMRLNRFDQGWDLVINPRRSAGAASFNLLEREVERLVLKCENL